MFVDTVELISLGGGGGLFGELLMRRDSKEARYHESHHHNHEEHNPVNSHHHPKRALGTLKISKHTLDGIDSKTCIVLICHEKEVLFERIFKVNPVDGSVFVFPLFLNFLATLF